MSCCQLIVSINGRKQGADPIRLNLVIEQIEGKAFNSVTCSDFVRGAEAEKTDSSLYVSH